MSDTSEVTFETLGRIGPCEIRLKGFPFSHFDGGEGCLIATIPVESGDYQAVLDSIVKRGGAYVPSKSRPGSYWFLPWPCAAVHIRPITGAGAFAPEDS